MWIPGGIGAWRAHRLRIAWLSLPLLLLVILIPFFARRTDPVRPATDSDPSRSSALDDSTESDSGWETVTDVVRRGDTFSGLLLRNRLGM